MQNGRRQKQRRQKTDSSLGMRLIIGHIWATTFKDNASTKPIFHQRQHLKHHVFSRHRRRGLGHSARRPQLLNTNGKSAVHRRRLSDAHIRRTYAYRHVRNTPRIQLELHHSAGHTTNPRFTLTRPPQPPCGHRPQTSAAGRSLASAPTTRQRIIATRRCRHQFTRHAALFLKKCESTLSHKKSYRI